MKIAIAAYDADQDAQISQHGARAPYYLIYDENGNFQEAVSNPYANAERGAGPKAAHFLIQQGIQLLVADGFGGRFVDELDAGGIKQLQKTGIVSDIITDITAT
jgi:predicted Fe-Mo cluster-binding NifX family protein